MSVMAIWQQAAYWFEASGFCGSQAACTDMIITSKQHRPLHWRQRVLHAACLPALKGQQALGPIESQELLSTATRGGMCHLPFTRLGSQWSPGLTDTLSLHLTAAMCSFFSTSKNRLRCVEMCTQIYSTIHVDLSCKNLFFFCSQHQTWACLTGHI